MTYPPSGTVPAPPEPFDPETSTIVTGTPLVRVFSNSRQVTTFNPAGAPGATRFAFFGDPPTPVLYAAETHEAAVHETLLHDVPLTGGSLHPRMYTSRVLGGFHPTRDLRLANFAGSGLRRLGVRASNLTDTDADQYPMSCRWAASALAAGLDGITYMSRQRNTDRAFVLFGDRVAHTDLTPDASVARTFVAGPDFDWLVDVCTAVKVEVIAPV